MTKLADLTATEASRRMKAGELTALAYADAFIARVAEREADVQAWVHLDPEYVRAAARAADERRRDGRAPGPLNGIPIGVKDVILPGDVRELLNKVVEAERTAKANLIRRQEETAATRSLLNTARLMEDNPLLLRLKELEALEKLVEKVGRIDLHTGNAAGGLDALLQNLYRLRGEGDATKPA